ncbi:hypothetical protein COTS27_01562 [Spirochaetota bacterium]|nr:hypothetical protein COTS27_01562 [Spirochaetota bacterium]
MIVWTISALPLVLGACIKMLIGALWYSPLLFGKYWMKSLGFQMEDIQSEEGKRSAKIGYLLSSLTALTSSYIIGVLLASLEVTTGGEAFRVLLLLIACFTMPVILGRHLWAKHPWGLFPIDLGYEWVTLTLIALIYVWF